MGLKAQSSSSNVIYGLTGPFKLERTAGIARPSRKIINGHLSTAQADIATIEVEMTLLTPTAILDPGEWVFETQDGVLRIANLDAISPLVPADVQNGTIDMSPVELGPSPIVVNAIAKQPLAL